MKSCAKVLVCLVVLVVFLLIHLDLLVATVDASTDKCET
jgi:hypothetical protein